MSGQPQSLWAEHAWLIDGSATNVLLRIGPDGRWSDIEPDVTQPPPDAQRITGPLLPSIVNAHSHAFQRAFAGLAERRENEHDDFWSWRDRMYRVALRITPEQLRAIAAQLFVELLQGGYTQVCEFHYLQHDTNGHPYTDPHAMAWAIADAAEAAGIGLTLMPALYERAGFSAPALRNDQRRFATHPRSVRAQAQAIAGANRPLLRAGVVVHSLRAAAPAAIHELRRLAAEIDGPIHIHVAEQTAEVNDCLIATGCRPIEWLAREGLLDPRWQLVHATHTVASEIDAVAHSGAGVVICPSTEANLGDGFCDLGAWLTAGVPVSIGSDSHVTRDAREELRWLEYGQRLLHRRRNVSAAPLEQEPGTAQRLWRSVQEAAAAASGEPAWGLVVGARADALVPDAGDPTLLGVPNDRTLDALVFSSPGRPWADVMVAGRWVIRGGRHPRAEAVSRAFSQAMEPLWANE